MSCALWRRDDDNRKARIAAGAGVDGTSGKRLAVGLQATVLGELTTTIGISVAEAVVTTKPNAAGADRHRPLLLVRRTWP